jgi:4-hydroxybenzoate polyprenyltransferase
MGTLVGGVACLILALILKKTGHFKKAVLEPLFMWVALFGIVALCQPFFFWLYQWGFTILLTGTIGFNVAINLKK